MDNESQNKVVIIAVTPKIVEDIDTERRFGVGKVPSRKAMTMQLLEEAIKARRLLRGYHTQPELETT